eukprot:m.107239 g.107239  ORF g.107239 m.107239 type:complete len:824 (+) comp12687_c0_seq1:52-2523(+)
MGCGTSTANKVKNQPQPSQATSSRNATTATSTSTASADENSYDRNGINEIECDFLRSHLTAKPPACSRMGDMMGVSCDFLLHFIEEYLNTCNKRTRLTCDHVVEQSIKPTTSVHNCAFIDYFLDTNGSNGSSLIGKATVYVSFSWKNKFFDVLDSLCLYAEKHPHVYFWLDAFSSNINTNINTSSSWKRSLNCNIGSVGKMLIFLSPWRCPFTLTQTSSLWEIYAAIESELEMETIFPKSQLKLFLDTIAEGSLPLKMKNNDGYNTSVLPQLFPPVELNAFECQSGIDRNLLVNTIGDEVGATKVTQMITNEVKERLVLMASKQCILLETKLHQNINNSTNIDHRLGKDKVSTTKDMQREQQYFSNLCWKTGELEMALGNTTQSLDLFLKALPWYEQQQKRYQLEKITLYFQIGKAYLLKEDYKLAQEFFIKASAKTPRKDRSSDNYQSLLFDVHANMAELYLRTGRLNHAKELLTRRLSSPQQWPQRTIVFENNLALVYAKCVGDVSSAEQWCKHALLLATNSFGEHHVSTASVWDASAIVFSCKGEYGEATNAYNKAVAIRQAAHDPDCIRESNLAMAHSLHTMGCVRETQANNEGDDEVYEEALQRYWKALALRELELGKSHPLTQASRSACVRLQTKRENKVTAMEHFFDTLGKLETAAQAGNIHEDEVARVLENIRGEETDWGSRSSWGRKDYLKNSYLLSQAVFGSAHLETARSGCLVADALVDEREDLLLAERIYSQALQIRLAIHGENHPSIVAVYCQLGKLLLLFPTDVEKARASFTKAINTYHNCSIHDIEDCETFSLDPLIDEAQRLIKKVI